MIDCFIKHIMCCKQIHTKYFNKYKKLYNTIEAKNLLLNHNCFSCKNSKKDIIDEKRHTIFCTTIPGHHDYNSSCSEWEI
jgi:hypothetical protein